MPLTLPLLLLCPPVTAGPTQFCEAVEDNDASSVMREHAPTFQVLARLETDRFFSTQDAAAQLSSAADRKEFDIRLTATTTEGKSRVNAYRVLAAMRAGGTC
jgi:hypothetical protein